MPGPREQEKRKTEFDPSTLEKGTKIVNQAVSSKRRDEQEHPGQQPEDVDHREMPTRQNPGGRRSSSDSNVSRRTRGG